MAPVDLQSHSHTGRTRGLRFSEMTEGVIRGSEPWSCCSARPLRSRWIVNSENGTILDCPRVKAGILAQAEQYYIYGIEEQQPTTTTLVLALKAFLVVWIRNIYND